MIYLASASPRRRQLLRAAGIEHELLAVDVDESLPGEVAPDAAAPLLAERKARAAGALVRSGRILGADTIVALDGAALGKPSGSEEARDTLRRLSGRRHSVFTGVCVLDVESGGSRSGVEVTQVWFRALEEEEIREYVESGEPFDKAGGYGIQGAAAAFVSRIEGPRDNVIGLPMKLVREMLRC